MKLSLHIGTPKTGTTSCQQWFAANRDVLREQGVIYPVSLGEINHRAITSYSLNTNRMTGAFKRPNVETAEEHEVFRAQLRDSFAVEIQQYSQAHHWVISNEHLYSRIKTIEMIGRVKEFFAPHFEEISIYLHLRPQVDLLLSNTSQNARLGQKVSLKILTRPAIGEKNDFFNYDGITRRWEAVFGRQNVHLVPFRKIPNITEYLAQKIGIDRQNTSEIPYKNEAFGWRSMALVNALGDGVSQLENLSQTLFLDQLPAPEKLQIGLEVAREIQYRFNACNAKLAERREDITVEELTPDWDRYDTPPNVHKLEENSEFAEPLTYLINRYRQEVLLERGRAMLAEAELAIITRHHKARWKLQQASATVQLPQCLPELQQRMEELKMREAGLRNQMAVSEKGIQA